MGVAYFLPNFNTSLRFQSDDGLRALQQGRLTWTAVCESGSDNEITVLSDPRCPRLRMPDPRGGYAAAVNVEIDRRSVLVYDVIADFETLVGNVGGPLQNNNPLLIPPDIEFDWDVSEDEIDEDADGNPIIMVTGEELIPRLRKKFYDGVARVTRNLATFDPVFYSSYIDSVNDDTFCGMPAGTCRLIPPKAKSVSDANFTYWKAFAEVLIRRGGSKTTDEKAWYRRTRRA